MDEEDGEIFISSSQELLLLRSAFLHNSVPSTPSSPPTTDALFVPSSNEDADLTPTEPPIRMVSLSPSPTPETLMEDTIVPESEFPEEEIAPDSGTFYPNDSVGRPGSCKATNRKPIRKKGEDRWCVKFRKSPALKDPGNHGELLAAEVTFREIHLKDPSAGKAENSVAPSRKLPASIDIVSPSKPTQGCPQATLFSQLVDGSGGDDPGFPAVKDQANHGDLLAGKEIQFKEPSEGMRENGGLPSRKLPASFDSVSPLKRRQGGSSFLQLLEGCGGDDPGFPADIFDVVSMLMKKRERRSQSVDLLQVAEEMGLQFSPPKWHNPEGYGVDY